jgi:hypothetical protein
MEFDQFKIGEEFWMSGKHYRCTDIGTRTIIAICIDLPLNIVTSVRGKISREQITSDRDAADWFSGPPYAVPEIVICGYDFPACHQQKEEVDADG